jgi:uncharacterized protein YcsI (UPF0317 family)
MDAELASLREAIRAGRFRETTSGCLPGRVQANLVILPVSLAADFRLFCERNPRPCPLLEETDPGDVSPRRTAPSADVRTDAPRYRIYERGRLAAEVGDISSYWRDDLVTFLLGCSFTFERALTEAGIPLRHQEQGKVVPMYVTSIATSPAGIFQGPLVVSMRPVPESLVATAVAVTERFPLAHGAPVSIGGAEALGIRELARPDFGEPVEIRDGDVPLFWACGVTPQAVALRAKPELLITHAPGHMFFTDLTD